MTIDTEKLRNSAKTYGIALDDAALARLDLYAERLIETNKHVNLTAITEPEDILYKHFLDSLTIFRYVQPLEGARWIDVGTGAGVPGFVLLAARPDLRMTLLDGTKKKLQFVQDTLDAAGLSAQTLHTRAEEAGQDAAYRERFDFATARAVANLRELSEYCLPFLRVGGTFIAMKSKKTDEEIDEAQGAIRLLGGRIARVESFELPCVGERTLILIEKLSHTPAKYPRPSAKIAKQPLK